MLLRDARRMEVAATALLVLLVLGVAWLNKRTRDAATSAARRVPAT
jgi:hypothetical protein